MYAPYPSKHYADFTTADREAMRRYEQGVSHAKQGRADLFGQCQHYDAGYAANQEMKAAA